jgi:hypothetical protein
MILSRAIFLVLWLLLLSVTTAFVPPTLHGRTTSARLQAVTTEEELLTLIRQGMKEIDATTAWEDCVTLLSQQVQQQQQQAELLLATAWGWKGWVRAKSTARKYMTPPRHPNVQQLQDALDWLQQGPLALQDEALKAAIVTSPRSYLVDPKAAYQVALDTAPARYQKDPAQFHALLLRDYSVLECSFNCTEEGCSSECGNCWISYERSKGTNY